MKFPLRNFATVAALSLIFALAAVVRFECARDELWIDEYITAWTVAGSFEDVGERARISHQGTLYTWLTFGATRVFGISAASLRGLSVISGLALVVLGAWLAWQLTKLRSAAILAAFLAAVDPNFVFYASEARPYALVQLLGFCSACCVANWYSQRGIPKFGKPCATLSLKREGEAPAEPMQSQEERLSRSVALPKILDVEDPIKGSMIPLAIWMIATIEMFYCHFTSLFAIASQALIGWTLALRSRGGKTQWLIATIIAAMMSIPGVVALYAMADRAGDWRAFSSLTELLGSLHFSGLMYFLPAITGLACACADRRVRPNADWIGVLLLLSIAVSTVSAVVLVTSLGIAPLGHYRYVIAATGLGPALGATYLAALKPAWMRGIAAAALGLAAWLQTSIGGNLEQGTLQVPLRWERWSQIANRINSETQDLPLPVIVFPNLIEDHRIADQDLGAQQSYYWAPFAVVNRIDTGGQVFALPTWLEDRFDASSLEKIRQAHGAWLVIRCGTDRHPLQVGSLAASIIDELRTKLNDQGFQLTHEFLGPAHSDVQLFRVRVSKKPDLVR